MIKRSKRTLSRPQEDFKQATFTALKGVDNVVAPTANNAAYNMLNFNVDSDGALSIRKPLIKCTSLKNPLNTTIVFSRRLYDGKTFLIVYKSSGVTHLKLQDDTGFVKYSLVYINTLNGARTVAQSIADISDVAWGNFENLSVINTATTTIIGGCTVDFTQQIFAATPHHEGYDSTLVEASYAKKSPRYLRIKYETSADALGGPGWVIEIVYPEPNTLSEDTVAFAGDLTLDNLYAIRDTYVSAFFKAYNVFAYIGAKAPFGLKPVAELNDDIMEGIERVDQLTESNLTIRMVPVQAVSKHSWQFGPCIVLKAFCNFPHNQSTLYGLWEYSSDGVLWNRILPNTRVDEVEDMLSSTPVPVGRYFIGGEAIVHRLKDYSTSESLKNDENDENDKDDSERYEARIMGRINASSEYDYISERIDCLVLGSKDISVNSINFGKYSYRFSVYSVEKIENTDPLYISVNNYDLSLAQYKASKLLGSVVYTPLVDTDVEFLYSDICNAVHGLKLYYKSAVYSYGVSLGCNVYVSNAGEFTTPITNLIETNTSNDSYVTCVIPWRDYILIASDKAIYLSSKTENGFLTRTINTFTGIPERDAKTCKAILNGIIFKSGSKVYTLTPNLASSTDSILNIADVSKPIAHLLQKYDTDTTNFAFNTEEAYYLFLSGAKNTYCFKYEYLRRIWCIYQYPCRIYDYDILNVDDIRLYAERDGEYLELYFEHSLKDIYPEADANTPYGDYFEALSNPKYFVLNKDKVTPVEFVLDTGDKCDNFSVTKQFVETKFLVCTKHVKDTIPIDVLIRIDGNEHKHHVSLTTDGAFVRETQSDTLTLGGTVDTDNVECLNVFRQMFLRYSGKGKSIRHVISGTSTFPFKIYELYHRYRVLNVKQ